MVYLTLILPHMVFRANLPAKRFQQIAPDSQRSGFSKNQEQNLENKNLELSVESVWLVGWLQKKYSGAVQKFIPNCFRRILIGL